MLLDWPEIILRLGVATIVGGAVGLNRDMHGKPVGVRTLGLVALATAVIMLFAEASTSDAGRLSEAGSRVIQGILTGIGFLGAGVILHTEGQFKARGLTSAACVWFTACVGTLCGAGQWRLVIVSVALVFLLLIFGGPIEKTIHGLTSSNEPELDIKRKNKISKKNESID